MAILVGMNDRTDLIVVGSGIIGLATAFLAHERGLAVRVIDAADRPVGSSIQNFGHACFTAQADVIQPVAEVARDGWLRASRAAGFWAAESGTWIPARSDVERRVLEEFAEHRGLDQVRLIDADDVATGIGNPKLKSLGGAHLPNDMRVDPREAAPALAAWLAGEGVEFTWNTQVTHVVDGIVSTVRGDYTAEQVVVAPGFKLMGLFPEIAERYEVRICELVMTLIERPERISRELAVLTGTSMTRYEGFSTMPSIEELREELDRREPGLVECTANLMMTGNEHGIFVGDSHEYSMSPDPFIAEELSELLLGRGTALLGIERPRVLQRWKGRYADSQQTNLVLERPDEKTTVAVVTSGIGMTLSFGIADLALSGGSVENF